MHNKNKMSHSAEEKTVGTDTHRGSDKPSTSNGEKAYCQCCSKCKPTNSCGSSKCGGFMGSCRSSC